MTFNSLYYDDMKVDFSPWQTSLEFPGVGGQLKTNNILANSNSGPYFIYNHLVKINGTQMIPHVNADKVWEMLLQDASRNSKVSTTTASQRSPAEVAIEVGMYSVKQCISAVEAGLEAFCIEASPRNFGAIERDIKFKYNSREIQARLHVQNRAAGPVSGQLVPFSSQGGTGDHVGVADAWKMSPESSARTEDDEASGRQHNSAKTTSRVDSRDVVEVKTLALDDLIDEIDRPVYILKIDTQGYELQVLKGMHRSLREHKIQYILLEYWPRGLDLMATSGITNETTQPCSSGNSVLRQLWDVNYTLYHMSVIAHPAAGRPRAYRSLEGERPLKLATSFSEYCQWYLDLEITVHNPDYKMGYWTDILAVAPNDDGSRRIPALTLPSQVVSKEMLSVHEGQSIKAEDPPEIVTQIVGMAS